MWWRPLKKNLFGWAEPIWSSKSIAVRFRKNFKWCSTIRWSAFLNISSVSLKKRLGNSENWYFEVRKLDSWGHAIHTHAIHHYFTILASNVIDLFLFNVKTKTFPLGSFYVTIVQKSPVNKVLPQLMAMQKFLYENFGHKIAQIHIFFVGKVKVEWNKPKALKLVISGNRNWYEMGIVHAFVEPCIKIWPTSLVYYMWWISQMV